MSINTLEFSYLEQAVTTLTAPGKLFFGIALEK